MVIVSQKLAAVTIVLNETRKQHAVNQNGVLFFYGTGLHSLRLPGLKGRLGLQVAGVLLFYVFRYLLNVLLPVGVLKLFGL